MESETHILHAAIEKLEEILGPIGVHTALLPPEGKQRDCILQLQWQNRTWRFAVQVIERLTPPILAMSEESVGKPRAKRLLVTMYAAPPVARLVREMGLAFIDTAGNAFISQPPLLVYVTGNSLEQRPHSPGRLFRQAGLRILYALLCNRGLESQAYRTIANLAGVALGTVDWIMRDLVEAGYLVRKGTGGRVLIKKGDLLYRWVTAYPEQLRPKLLLGRYRAAENEPHWWNGIAPGGFETYWGGEVAAGILTRYLQPEELLLYADNEPVDLLLKFRLRKDPGGNTILYRRFWNFKDKWAERGLVHPVLIYADLLASGIGRNIETAKLIYGEIIDKLIR